jgi:MFS family permease
MGTVSPKERASASAISSMLWGIGASGGTFLAGLLLGAGTYLSLSSPMLIGSGVYLVAAIVFFLLFRGIPPPEETQLQPSGGRGS